MGGVLSRQDATVAAPIPLQRRVTTVQCKAERNTESLQFKPTVKKFECSFCKGLVSSVIHNFIIVSTVEEAFTRFLDASVGLIFQFCH